jgi:hypothetical protein
MSYPYFSGASDFPFVPTGITGDVQAFAPIDSGGVSKAQTWNKPRGVSMVYILVVDGGGGGGGGLTGATTTARGGGAGGACGCIACALYPAFMLPDVLRVIVGAGGAGGSGSGVNGGTGARSVVGTGLGIGTSIVTIPNIILMASTGSAGGGAAGTNSGAATGGAVQTVAAKGTIGWPGAINIVTFTVGLVGAAGGTPTAAGSNITAGWNTTPLTPGGGGGGVTSAGTGFAGGSITLQGILDHADGNFAPAAILGGGAAGGAGAAGNGQPGIISYKPFLMTGGTGGGSADGAAGGIGGAAGIGCGGGGGGGGTTGGAGGNGGNGLVVIAAW